MKYHTNPQGLWTRCVAQTAAACPYGASASEHLDRTAIAHDDGGLVQDSANRTAAVTPVLADTYAVISASGEVRAYKVNGELIPVAERASYYESTVKPKLEREAAKANVDVLQYVEDELGRKDEERTEKELRRIALVREREIIREQVREDKKVQREQERDERAAQRAAAKAAIAAQRAQERTEKRVQEAAIKAEAKAELKAMILADRNRKRNLERSRRKWRRDQEKEEMAYERKDRQITARQDAAYFKDKAKHMAAYDAYQKQLEKAMKGMGNKSKDTMFSWFFDLFDMK